MSFLRYLRRRKLDDERRRELEEHVELEVDENVARGMSVGEAGAVARRKLGNATLIREEIYRMNTMHMVESFWKDLAYAMRTLRRNPGFAIVAVLSLALGIGANTAIFQLLDTVRLRTLPVENPKQLAWIHIPNRKWYSGNFDGRSQTMTFPLWEEIRASQEAFSSMAVWGTGTWNLAAGGEARFANGIWTSGNFFSTLGVHAALGRVFSAEDDRPGCGAPGAVISGAFWQREFAGDSNVIGRKLLLDGKPFEILGVTPQGFFGVEVGRQFDVAIPVCAEPLLKRERSLMQRRDGWWLNAIGRLKPGWSVTRASAHIASLSPSLIERTMAPNYDESDRKQYRSFRLGVSAWSNGSSDLRDEYENPLWLLQGIAGLVLPIACANLTNLMLARASAREREIAVRLAIGASRWRLVRQLLAESLLLTALGAAAGMALAEMLSRSIVAFLTTESDPLFVEVHADWRILLFLTALTVFTCVLIGLAPALRATNLGPATALKSGGRGSTGERRQFDLRRLLVVSQVALSLVLLCGALLFVRSLRNLVRIDAGFKHSGVMIASFNYKSLEIPKERRNFLQADLLQKMQAIPGVESAAISSIVPLGNSSWTLSVDVDGKAHAARRGARISAISDDYFRLLEMPLLAGRTFDRRDQPLSSHVAVVNEAFTKRFFPNENPIGKQFRTLAEPDYPEVHYEIVGVVRNTKYLELREEFRPILFLPLSQDPNPRTDANILIRTGLPLGTTTASIKRAAAQVNPGIILRFWEFDTQILDSMARERLMAMLAGVFGLLAAMLAMIGLYGVISYSVARRRSEIGIRMALGASGHEVVGMVLWDAGGMLLAGLAVGGALTFGLSRAAESLLYGLTPRDPLTIGVSTLLLAMAALLASYIPARRAARVDPMLALREE